MNTQGVIECNSFNLDIVNWLLKREGNPSAEINFSRVVQLIVEYRKEIITKDIDEASKRLFEMFSTPLDSGDFGSGVKFYMSQEDLQLALKQFILELNPNQ